MKDDILAVILLPIQMVAFITAVLAFGVMVISPALFGIGLLLNCVPAPAFVHSSGAIMMASASGSWVVAILLPRIWNPRKDNE